MNENTPASTALIATLRYHADNATGVASFAAEKLEMEFYAATLAEAVAEGLIGLRPSVEGPELITTEQGLMVIWESEKRTDANNPLHSPTMAR